MQKTETNFKTNYFRWESSNKIDGNIVARMLLLKYSKMLIVLEVNQWKMYTFREYLVNLSCK